MDEARDVRGVAATVDCLIEEAYPMFDPRISSRRTSLSRVLELRFCRTVDFDSSRTKIRLSSTRDEVATVFTQRFDMRAHDVGG